MTAGSPMAPLSTPQTLTGGFADPVAGSQRVFRAALNALAHPGREYTWEAPVEPVRPLTPGLAALTLTLADADTPVWLDPTLSPSGPVRQWLAFHCGCPIVEDPADAAFTLITAPQQLPRLDSFPAGSDIDPHTSATLLVDVTAGQGITGITPGHAADPAPAPTVVLTGPGIDGRRRRTLPPLPSGFPDQWQANHDAFPAGADIIFVTATRLWALPRTTLITASGSAATEGGER